MSNLNPNATADARKVVSGKDAQVFITGSDGKAIFLGEVESFQAQMAVNSAVIRALGTVQEMAYSTGYKVTVAFTEMVVRDDVLLEPIYRDIENGIFPRWDIRGQVIRGADGQTHQQTFGDCVPDGTIDLLNIAAGDIIKRPWSFVSNATPKLLSYFK